MIKWLVEKIIIMKKNIFTDNKLCLSVRLNFKTILSGKNVIHKNVNIKDSIIGYSTYIGPNSSIINCKIGKFCSISSDVSIVRGRHPSNTFVSTHPAFFSTMKQSGYSYVSANKFVEYKYADGLHSVVIGNDVWIGSNVLIMEGVIIGDGAIIGAGSIVTKDIRPYSICAGNPCKLIKLRFDENQIEILEKIRWWNKNNDWINTHSNLFDNIDLFIKEIDIDE